MDALDLEIRDKFQRLTEENKVQAIVFAVKLAMNRAGQAERSMQVFEYQKSGIRVLELDGAPWWVLADVCKALELSNPSVIAERLDPDERAKSNLGRQGNGWIINESGLYSVILRSDKPEAKKFKRWVTHEVLPAIRQTGSYSVDQTATRERWEAEVKLRETSLKAECYDMIRAIYRAESGPKAI